jgi:hypothetical protein
MPYIGTQPNDVKKNTGLYTPSEILKLTKDGSWGGSLELIEEQTVSGVSGVEFINLANKPYSVYVLYINNATTTSNSQMYIRFSNNNGTSFISSVDYRYAYFYGTTANVFQTPSSSGLDKISTNFLSSSSSVSSSNGYVYFYNLLDSDKFSTVTYHNMNEWIDTRMGFGGGSLSSIEAHNAIQVNPSAGNLSGNFKLLGIKQ